MSKKATWDSGRIETVLAGVVLLVVIALFVKFNALDDPAVPAAPTPVETRTVGETTSPPSQP